MPNVTVELQGQTYREPDTVSLQSYTSYTIKTHDIDGYSAAWHTAKVATNRGQVVDVALPFVETTVLTGEIPSRRGGVAIALLDKRTGKQVATGKTIFSGEYYITVPADLQDRIEVRELAAKAR